MTNSSSNDNTTTSAFQRPSTHEELCFFASPWAEKLGPRLYELAKPFYKAQKLLDECFLGFVRERFLQLDDNWNTLSLAFEARLGYHEVSRATLNGPKEGSTDVLALVRDSVPRSVLYALRAFADLDETPREDEPTRLTVYNPDFTFVAVEDRTYVTFENCYHGYVTKVGNKTFTVESCPFGGGRYVTETYTIARARRELAQCHRSLSGNLVSVRYLNTDVSAKALVETDKEEEARAQERWEREQAVEAAKQTPTPADHASSEGEKEDGRLAAQATIIHALMPFLPGPSRG